VWAQGRCSIRRVHLRTNRVAPGSWRRAQSSLRHARAPLGQHTPAGSSPGPGAGTEKRLARGLRRDVCRRVGGESGLCSWLEIHAARGIFVFILGSIIIRSPSVRQTSALVVRFSRRLAVVGDVHTEIEAYTASAPLLWRYSSCRCRTRSAQR